MKEILPVNDTTYEVEMPSGDKLLIGDKDSKDFKPHIKLYRWGEECFIKVELPTTEKASPIIEGDKVKFKGKDIEAHFYPLEPTTVIAKDKDGNNVPFSQNELGGFEFEVILKKKPVSNQIILNIETQGLKFYYQPELTPQEIAEGSVRPDNVVGSYAVYHATRTNMHRNKADAEKYKCGKAFHIYRPKITDAEGHWIWGELSLDEQAGTLTTTIPQDFLDSAVYPVSTGTSNFGYEIIGSLQLTIARRDYAGSNTFSRYGTAWSGVDGTAVSLSVHLAVSPGQAVDVTAVINQEDSQGSGSHGETAKKQNTSVSEAGNWVVFTLNNGSLSSANSYILSALGDATDFTANSKNCYVKYDNNSNNYYFTNVGSYTISDPWNDAANTGRMFSIYCTYEEAANISLENKSANMAAKMVAGKLI